MAQEIRQQNNSSKKTTHKKKRKSKLYMKRSVRLTTAALFMITALVVAFIPVKRGVSATTEGTIPSVDELSYNAEAGVAGKHQILDKQYTKYKSIKGADITDNSRYAYPYDDYITTNMASDGKQHTYFKVKQGDGSGMPLVPVPIYILGQESASGIKEYINKYIGKEMGYDPPGQTVSLSDTIACNPGKAQSTPYTVCQDQDIIDLKKAGTYELYREEDVTGAISGTSDHYKIVKVTKELHTVVNEPTQTISGDDIITEDHFKDTFTTETFYACKDSDDGTSKALVQNIRYISDGAFKDAGHISSIDIPDKINAIGNSAFENCGLTSAKINVKCEFIGDRAFYKCGSLTNVQFSENQGDSIYLGDCAFAETALQSFRFPKSGDMYIGSGCLANNTDLTNVDFSNTVRTITMGCYVFGDDRKLTTVDLKNVGHLITHKGTGEENNVGCGIFSGCTSLSEVTFDDCFSEELTRGTFADCPSLYFVKFRNGNAKFWHDPTTKESDFTGMKNSFHLWSDFNPSNPTVKNNIHKLCEECSITFRYELEKGENFEYFDSNKYRYTFSKLPDGNYIITDINEENVPAGKDELNIPYSICDVYNITQIGDNAAQGLTKPTHINISDSISSIGDHAFANMPNVTKVYWQHNRSDTTNDDVPAASEVKLGAEVFFNCKNLDSIHLRHYSYASDGTIADVYDPNITDIKLSTVNGKNAGPFYTDNPDGTTVYGAMYNKATKQSYLPFTTCMDVDTGKCNNKQEGYINYVTEGPELMTAKYDKALDKACLTSYPTKDTQAITRAETISGNRLVWNPTADGGKGDYTFYTDSLQNMVRSLTGDSPAYNWDMKEMFEHIYVPGEITSLDKLMVTYKDPDEVEHYFQNLKPIKAADGVTDLCWTSEVTLGKVVDPKTGQNIGVNILPNDAFASLPKDSSTPLNEIVPSTIEKVVFENDMLDIGALPFRNSKNLKIVDFKNENNPTDEASIKAGNKSYDTSLNDGMIYASQYDKDNDHIDKTIVEFLPGYYSEVVKPASDITRIENGAFENCDKIFAVDFTECNGLVEEMETVNGKKVLHQAIPEFCFYDADNLDQVDLPESVHSVGKSAFTPELTVEQRHGTTNNLDRVKVRIPSTEINIDDTAFSNNDHATLRSYPESAAERYANSIIHPNVYFESLGKIFYVTFLDYDGKILSQEKVLINQYIQTVPNPSDRDGYTFTGWVTNSGQKPTDKVTSDLIFIPTYTPIEPPKPDPDPTSSSSGSTSGGGGSSSGGSSSGGSSNSSSSSSSSSSNNNTASSSMIRPVIVSGAPAPYEGAAGLLNNTATGATGNNNGGSNVQTGNTAVNSSVNGLGDNGKMSATVNGSTDNYIIKITETEEAKANAVTALSGAFGSLDNIRYVPFDISLYDSTGTQKITPLPDGVTVSITMPIPNDLAIYGGNAKVASTSGGMLETIQPRFTVIDNVPCMNYTVTHLSPYVVYVDTANLTEAGIADATPKTGDPIHPKWFLSIGFAAISVFLFLKRDKKTKKAKAA